MTKYSTNPTNHERHFAEDEIIVSKTDMTGHILYANDIFLRVSGFSEQEVLGQPHSIIRHPDMPRCVFKLLWDTLSEKQEIFAYVKNLAKNGDYYWVLAHVTPSFNVSGEVIGYHSNRRCPRPEAVKAISDIYQSLLEEEHKHQNAKEGMKAGWEQLTSFVQKNGGHYDELILSI